MERVDLQALIRSLSGQIARAFLDQNPQLQKQPPRPGVVLNASAAEMLLRALLTPENIAALLGQGAWASSTRAARKPGRFGACPRSARRSTPVPCRPDALLFRRPAELRRRPGQPRWAISRPHEALRPDLAPVGRRHSRAGHGAAGEPHRAADRRSGRPAKRLKRFPVARRPVAVPLSAWRRRVFPIPHPRAQPPTR